jgi:hypothetical protein
MTLIDTIVGASLMLLVFVGVAGAFQLSLDVVINNKARAGAIALGNERMEYLRSLAYSSVGTIGGIPAGNVPQTETLTFNGIRYVRRVFVSYQDDPKDGTGGADQNGITADYKAIRVDVSWVSRGQTRDIVLVGRMSPVGIETTVSGGTLVINTVNAALQPLSGAMVTIVNGGASPPVNLTTYTDATGKASFIGTPPASGYQITITKPGFSTAGTYSPTAQNTNPSPAHLTIANNVTTSGTFAIDVLANKYVQTYSPIQPATSTDQMNDASRLAVVSSTTVASGLAQLTGSPGSYQTPGHIQSTAIVPAYLTRWKSLSWVASKPSGTGIVYRVYNGGGDQLIPDAQLPGNAAGFTTSPVNLTGVSTTTYPTIRLDATLTTTNPNATPSLDSWSVSYDYGPTPLPGVTFTITSTKTIGSGPAGPVYKVRATSTTDANAQYAFPNIEWDTYTLASGSTTLDIASACNPQPEYIAPGANQTTALFFLPHTTNSLLVDVKDASGNTISGASVRLYRTKSPASDTTILSDTCGNTFFSTMAQGTASGNNAYSISVSATGHTTYTSTSVNVQGASRLSVVLN